MDSPPRLGEGVVSSALTRRRLPAALLRQLLDEPELAAALRALPASALRQVILRVGLEDAGELVALSTLEQLREVFDEDLWRSARPGQDEAFDAARFVVWLEVLLEGGEAFVAERLAELSEDFLVFAFSRLVRVLDVVVLTTWATDPAQADLLDEVVATQPCQELDEYLMLSRTEWGWDAVLTTLLALDERHPELLRAILSRCAAATHEEVRSAEGLHAALRAEEQLLEDARAEREERRAERGYVSPAAARAFLALARTAPEGPEDDPITRAYFRELKPVAAAGPAATAVAALPEPPPLRQLLLAAGVETEALEAAPAAGSLFRQTLAELYQHDPRTHQRLVEELAYLANVLIAGDTEAARSWRPAEAAERVLELCDEGLRATVHGAGSDPATAREALLRWGAVGLFRVAWASHGGAG
jgi:Family of unknown function (DUF6178)